jgi:sarcosine oxidase
MADRHIHREGAPERSSGPPGTLTRREFVRRAASGTGALATAGGLAPLLAACGDSDPTAPLPFIPGPDAEVAVVGAGAFGGWTALRLQEMGAQVTLLDREGPGNPRSSSGDETRGIRTAYGGRTLWTRWAARAIQAWRDFDDEWAAEVGGPLFHSAGDLILRPSWAGFMSETRATFDAEGVAYEVLEPEAVEARWPWIRTDGLPAAMLELDAGVARARKACEAVAEVLVRKGGRLRTGEAEPGGSSGDLLRDLRLDSGETVEAEVFVFALGPWFLEAFPGLLRGGMAVPMGHVYYFGPPEGDPRFVHPGMPTWNIPGVTGWPSLPLEPVGFRVRVGGRSGGSDPGTSDRSVPEGFHAAARQVLEDRFPDLADAPLLDARACHYDMTGSGGWFVDIHPEWRNVWLIGGGNAEGFKFGPVLGEYIASRVLGEDPHPELAAQFRL